MDQGQWRMEQEHLQQVYRKICQEIARREQRLAGHRQNLLATRRSVWEDIPHNWQQGDLDAAVEVKQYLDGLKQSTQIHDQSVLQLRKLKRMQASPYFGRVDFTEAGAHETERIYIGVLSFFDAHGNLLIYDWRAPISSIFYDYELGPVAYQCLDGTMEGTVSLKRQYRITENVLHYMFDTGLKIDDELLQEILSKSTDEKMRTIVQTIQKEQNRIIRDESHQVLMVQGAAGSGKTSIALHRIAYLLYKYRDQNITAQNILIFSPNTVFNDYISHVLPELGEENMQQTTFYEYMRKMVSKAYTSEDPASYLETLLTTAAQPAYQARHQGVRYKSSMGFLSLLNAYAKTLEGAVRFEDLTLGNTVLVSRQEMMEMYRKAYRYLPLARRLRKIRDRVCYLLRPHHQRRYEEILADYAQDSEKKDRLRAHARLAVYQEFKPVREKLASMLAFNLYEAYVRLFLRPKSGTALDEYYPEDWQAIWADTAARLQARQMGYEDLSGYVYLRGLLFGVLRMAHIRHVVVDEAQDYTPVQYGVLKQLFPNTRMTLLGDFNQAVNPFYPSFRYEQVRAVLEPDSDAILKLTKSYRSTLEIIEFTSTILQTTEIEPVRRSGTKPKWILASDAETLLKACVRDAKDLLRQGMESIGILTKTAAQSVALHQRLQTHLPVQLLTKDDTVFPRGVLILPVYLAKGLEFDGAFVLHGDAETYSREADRLLFYTACTRALHHLHLYAAAPPSPFGDKTLCDIEHMG